MAADDQTPGKNLWENWADALKAAAAPVSVYQVFLDQWRNAAGITGERQANAAPSNFFEAFFGGQQALLRMSEIATEAMRTLGATGAGSAPNGGKAGSPSDGGGSASDPAAQYQRYLAEFSEKLTANPLLSSLELWLNGAAQYQRMAQPWTELMQQSLGGAAAMNGPAGAGDPLGAALERSFGLLADFPGLNNELPALMREAAGNLLALQRAREGYRVIMTATWQRAFEEITREMLRRAAGDKPVASPGALLALTTSVADRVFVETFRSERYISAQQQLSSALADHRRCEARIVDLFARSGHFPTRREHDEALREITELRRDVHALKRAVRSLAAAGRATALVRPVEERAAPSATRRNGSAPESGAAAVSEKPKRRLPNQAAMRTKSYPKRTDHGN